MITSCTNAEKGAPTVPPSPPSYSPATAPAAAPRTAQVPSGPPMNAEIVQIADNLTQQILECQAYSTCWLINAGRIIDHYQRQSIPGQMTTIHNSARLPWGQRYCQFLARMARNPALS